MLTDKAVCKKKKKKEKKKKIGFYCFYKKSQSSINFLKKSIYNINYKIYNPVSASKVATIASYSF